MVFIRIFAFVYAFVYDAHELRLWSRPCVYKKVMVVWQCACANNAHTLMTIKRINSHSKFGTPK